MAGKAALKGIYESRTKGREKKTYCDHHSVFIQDSRQCERGQETHMRGRNKGKQRRNKTEETGRAIEGV